MKEEDLLKLINPEKMPRHIAIIMDGNGRWAKQQGLLRVMGHKAGIEAIKDIITMCSDIGIQALTLYAFSVENWHRPKIEINSLMKLLKIFLRNEINELQRKNVKVMAIGRIQELPLFAQQEIYNAIDKTKNNTGLILNLALNYSGRVDILEAVRKIIEKYESSGLNLKEFDEESFSSFLYTSGLPEPDLLIRTSGEYRLSNFMLWQLAYTELWITDILWPDFRKIHLLKAILDYQKRKRRFGKIHEGEECSENE
ncbi:MAG: isoprenyl transferase [bacterium]|nr:isoprenyl transferase [bacterium]